MKKKQPQQQPYSNGTTISQCCRLLQSEEKKYKVYQILGAVPVLGGGNEHVHPSILPSTIFANCDDGLAGTAGFSCSAASHWPQHHIHFTFQPHIVLQHRSWLPRISLCEDHIMM